jgi:hypothetical protein
MAIDFDGGSYFPCLLSPVLAGQWYNCSFLSALQKILIPLLTILTPISDVECGKFPHFGTGKPREHDGLG